MNFQGAASGWQARARALMPEEFTALPTTARNLVGLGLGAGLALRLWQYAPDTSQWLDEIAISLNVTGRTLWDLITLPLSWDQSAPKGFLLVEKLAVLAFGDGDHAFRLFPFLCAVAALPVFALLALRVLSRFGAVVAIALFSFAAPLVDYAGQVKPYSVDVAVTSALLLIATGLEDTPLRAVAADRGKWRRAGVAGALLAWFSQPSSIVLTALGAGLALRTISAWRASRKEISRDALRLALPLAEVMAWWSAAVVAVVFVAGHSITPSARAFLQDWWSFGFPPLSWAGEETTLWPLDQLHTLFALGDSSSLAYLWPEFYLGVALLGFAVLFWRGGTARLVVLPVALAVVAGIARQYPFSGRLILFLLPCFFLAMGAALSWIAEKLPAFALLPALAVLPALLTVLWVSPPYEIEAVKPLLAELRSEWKAGDVLYVYYRSGPAMMLYGQRYGFSEGDYAQGGCHDGNWREYLHELDHFRGKSRVWIMLMQMPPSYGERNTLLHYLDTIGVQRAAYRTYVHMVSHHGDEPTELLLYDLSGKDRLTAASAKTFPFLGEEDMRTCAYGPRAMVVAHGF
jgi:hypothetical protein